MGFAFAGAGDAAVALALPAAGSAPPALGLLLPPTGAAGLVTAGEGAVAAPGCGSRLGLAGAVASEPDGRGAGAWVADDRGAGSPCHFSFRCGVLAADGLPGGTNGGGWGGEAAGRSAVGLLSLERSALAAMPEAAGAVTPICWRHFSIA